MPRSLIPTLFALILLCFGSSAFAASMKWFERESQNHGVCKPSPVNRIVRPNVCLGFEMGVRLMA